MEKRYLDHDEVQAELRSVVEKYLDAMNHDDGPRIAKLTMGAAFFDLSFDERSISRVASIKVVYESDLISGTGVS